MPETLYLSVVHAGAKDRMVMRSLINLVNGRSSGVLWEIQDDVGGDVTIIDVDSEQGRELWSELRERSTRLIALSVDKHFAADSLLLKPLRAREFLGLLSRLAEGEVAPPADPEPTADAGASATDVGRDVEATGAADRTPMHAAGLTLADHLRCQTWQGPIVLTEPGWPLLLVDPGSGAWFFDGSIGDLDPAQFSRPLPDSAGVSLTSGELVERIQGHRQRPLSELKWYAGLAQLPGRLHPDLNAEFQFMLAQVPAEAMQNDALHQLARLLLRGPMDLTELIAESGQPEANVAVFLNGCYASGKLLINRDWRAAGF
ncbi:MAG: hypothetical protein EA419_03520 [Wenzhouxiangella sp.]|nr:MAG: hypothetical protein EA419_03520 [Wenzhouxiangella sp.]